jgi:hypothetical protein
VIFKSSGVKLTEEQQDVELMELNPMGRGRRSSGSVASKSSKNNYLTAVSICNVADLESDEEVLLVHKCTNSSTGV